MNPVCVDVAPELWILTPRALYRLPCRLNWPAWHPGTNLQFYENVGLFCKFEKFKD